MRYCDECKTESLTPGCPYCMTYKAKDLIKENKQLKQVNRFLKNELELINEQNTT